MNASKLKLKQKAKGTGRTRFNNSDIPASVLKQWTAVVIPRLCEYVGVTMTPCSVLTLPGVVQALWDEHFPAVHHVIEVSKDPVYSVVSLALACSFSCIIAIRQATQRLSEWRGQFASAAMDAVVRLWEGNPRLQQQMLRTCRFPDALYLGNLKNVFS